MDSQYVSRTLGRCLAEGLAELIELRPLDPIEFLSHWILKYKHNQQLELEKSAHQRQLEEEQRRLHEETLHQKVLQEEESRIRAEQIQCVPESADERKPGEDERDAAGDPADHTESETVNELNDQEEETTEAAGEDQTSEILNPEEDRSDTQNDSNEADAPSEENQLGAEKTEEDSDERQVEKEEDEEDDGAETTT